MILDRDLAALYGVPTKVLNQAVKRNEARFPEDFAFRLTPTEIANLKSHIVTSSSGHGGVRKPPLAFTEHGAIMAATILNSPRAIEMSIFVVRAFVRIRELADQHNEIAKRLTALEQKVAGHDKDLQEMFAALRSLLSTSEKPKRRIGFSRGGNGD
ncbi:MAG: ORF6N domain-containing protein [Thermoanaerobaculia bacterium]